LGAVLGLQLLAGHAQISLLSLLALTAYAVVTLLTEAPSHAARTTITWLAALALGIVIGLPQLLPALRLGLQSQRAGGLEGSFFTSYSFHPLLLATYVSPYLLGNPYPDGSIELMVYQGLLPLGLASVALWRARRVRAWGFLAVGLMGLLLAFGQWNPIYRYLRLVPLLNLFRVPARYLCWTGLALSVLAALGFDLLRAHHKSDGRHPLGLLALWALGVAGALILLLPNLDDVDALVQNWKWLPALFGLTMASTLILARRLRPQMWALLALSGLLVDLFALGAVLNLTYNATRPSAEVVQAPGSLSVLRQDDTLYRVYTKEEIIPAESVMVPSYYPNIALTYGVSSANVYLPLVPQDYVNYLAELDAFHLNLLNVRYYAIPQLLPVDEARELYDVENPFSALPVNTWLSLPLVPVTTLEIESYLSHSVALPDGELVAEIVLADASNRQVTIPLRAGVESAEWAYERSDVRVSIAHEMPPVASTWPARSGFPAEEHPGHTYLARAVLDQTFVAEAVLLRLHRSEAFVRVERIRMLGPAGEESLVDHLLGRGDHRIVYRSEDVLIYRNEDAFPRAYTVSESQVRRHAGGLEILPGLAAEAVGPVIVEHYGDLSVSLRAEMETSGYLILADLHYPGWRAEVDSASTSILRAEGIFRAIALPPGSHRVHFTYGPF
jgi:hypothetical protein